MIKDTVKEQKSHMDTSHLKQVLINFVVPLGMLIITLVIVLLVLKPAFKNKPLLTNDLVSKKQLRDDLQSKLVTLNRLVDFQNIVSENSALVDKVLVSEQEVPALMSQISQIAQNSGFSIKRLTYALESLKKEDPDSVKHELITVNLGVEGNVHQLLSFLKDTENAARLLSVQKFRYAIADTDSDTQLSVNLLITSPFLYVRSDAVTDDPIDLDISDTSFINLMNKLKNMHYYSSVYTQVKYEEAISDLD